MKKILTIILTLVMCLTMEIPVFAEAIDNNTNIPYTIQAKLTDENGCITYVEGYRQDMPMMISDESTFATAYTFNVYEYQLNKTGSDSALASTVTLIIYYTSYEDSSGEVYRLDRVRGYWAIQDVYVSVPQATLICGASGFSPQSGYVTQRQEVELDPLPQGFDLYTNFTDYVADGPISILGATLTILYTRGGGRRWTFEMKNILFSNGV